ncbi:MAG: hypothetical protein ACE5JV_00245 [Nitrososphaerales archaeon]
MSTCDVCGNKIVDSNYHIPAELRDENRIKFVHFECCSVDDIKRNLILCAQDQIRLYQDVVDLLKNTSPEKIREFETRYGTYEEMSQGSHIDHQIMISALISELKRKLG